MSWWADTNSAASMHCAVPRTTPMLAFDRQVGANVLHIRLQRTSQIDSGGDDYSPFEEERDVELPATGDKIDDVNFEFKHPVALRNPDSRGWDNSDRRIRDAGLSVPENSHRLMGEGETDRNLFIVRGLEAGGYDVRLLELDPHGRKKVLASQTVDVKDPPAPVELTVPPFKPMPPESPALGGVIYDSTGRGKLARVIMHPNWSTYTDLSGQYEVWGTSVRSRSTALDVEWIAG